MLGVLPVLALALAAWLLWERTALGARGLRHVLVVTAIVWGVLLAILTETLSALTAITRSNLAIAWGIAAAIVPAVLWRTPRRRALPPLRWRGDMWPAAGIAAIAGLTGMIALVAPPNNWDSMTYHMSRVAHWAQNQSVAHFPTHHPRQLFQNPWAEWAVLHFQVLSGTDRWANFVQWFAMVGSVVGVTLVAEQLGADWRGRLAAAVIAATLPMGILQASSTQNDYAVSFWVVCFAYLVVLVRGSEERHWGHAALLGAALGLAILTKATAYLFALPLGIWLTLELIRHDRRFAIPALFVVLASAAALNGGHFARNAGTFRSPLGSSPDRVAATNRTWGAPALMSNVVRNVALHVATPSAAINQLIDRGVRHLHQALGISVDDPRTTWPGVSFAITTAQTHEDFAGNPLHLGLLLLAMAVVFVRRRKTNRALYVYALALLSAFLVFVVVLRWQPWHSRLQLPLFVLAAPLIGTWLSQQFSETATHWAAGLFLAAAIPWLLYSSTRRLIGPRSILRAPRAQQYFANKPREYPAFDSAARIVGASGCQRVGVLIGGEGWEYPLWAFLRGNSGALRTPVQSGEPTLRHVRVANATATLPVPAREAFEPCAVVAIDADDSAVAGVIGDGFAPALKRESVQLFLSRRP